MEDNKKDKIPPKEIIDDTGKNKYCRVKEEPLGKGGFAVCYEYKSEDDGKNYAIKAIDKNKFKESNENEKIQKNKELIKSEINIQKTFNSSKIVKVKSFFEDENFVYIVLEKCENKTLYDLLQKRKYLTEIEVQCYIFQLIEGLKIIHKNNYIHRDLKPQNLFLDEKLELKIGDFGLVAKVTNGEKKTDNCGTLVFMAPEMVNCILKENDQDKKIGYSFEVDIWAIGVIMYNLLTGSYPFHDEENSKILQNIVKSDFIFPNDRKISNAAKDLIKQILEKNPKKRPGLVQILYHDFFHIYKFPKFFNISTFLVPPDIKEYNPDINEDEIMNKEVKLTKLYKEVFPDISEIRYENINKYVKYDQSKFIGYDNWISYFHKSNSNNFYYYELNNGYIGNIDEDGINIMYDKDKKNFYLITSEDNGQNKIEKYNKDECPHNLKEKLNKLLEYYYNRNKDKLKVIISEDNESIISEESIRSEDNDDKSKEKDSTQKKSLNECNITEKKEINDNDNNNKKQENLFYIKSIEFDKKAYFFNFSDNNEQIIFKKDKIEIIMSKKKENLIYVDKNKNRMCIPTINILKNTNRELIDKLKYIRNHSAKIIQEKLTKKYNETRAGKDKGND